MDEKLKEIEKVQKQEEELANYSGPDRVVPFEEIKREIDSRPQAALRVKTSITRLDELVGGFIPGELILGSGKPKSGKTLLFQTFSTDLSHQGIPYLWFSYEVTPAQFFERFPGLPTLGFMPREMRPAAMKWLETRVHEGKLKHDIRVVFIDHLHYLVDMARLRNPSLEIGTVLRELKGMAVRFNLIIFLICHTGKVRAGEEPVAEDIRDSSFVLQEPDTILMLWRLPGDKNEAMLRVEMCRRTGVIGKKIKLVKVQEGPYKGLLGEVADWSEGDNE